MGEEERVALHYEATGLNTLAQGAQLLTGINQGLELMEKLFRQGRDAVMMFVDTGAMIGGYERQMRALTGSAEVARERVQSLVDASGGIGESVKDILEAANALEIFGIYSERNLRVAEDTAKATGKSLLEVVDLITYAGEGATRGLKRLGINTVDIVKELGHELKLDTVAGLEEISRAVIDMFEKTYGGSSADAGSGYGGLLKRLGNEWERFKLIVSTAGPMGTVKSILASTLDVVEKFFQSGDAERLGTLMGETLADAMMAAVGTMGQVAVMLYRLLLDVTAWLQKSGMGGTLASAGVGAGVGGALGIPFGPAGIVAGARIGAGIGVGADVLSGGKVGGGLKGFFSGFGRGVPGYINPIGGGESSWISGGGGSDAAVYGPQPEPTQIESFSRMVNEITAQAVEKYRISKLSQFPGGQNFPEWQAGGGGGGGGGSAWTGSVTYGRGGYAQGMTVYGAIGSAARAGAFDVAQGPEIDPLELFRREEEEKAELAQKELEENQRRQALMLRGWTSYYDGLQKVAMKWHQGEKVRLKDIATAAGQGARDMVASWLQAKSQEWGMKAMEAAVDAVAAFPNMALVATKAKSALGYGLLATGGGIAAGMITAGGSAGDTGVAGSATPSDASERSYSRSQAGVKAQSVNYYMSFNFFGPAIFGGTDGLREMVEGQVIPIIGEYQAATA